MRNVLWINGRDVGRDFGIKVRRLTGLGGTWESAASSEAVLGRVGSLRDTGFIALNARDLTVSCVFEAADTTALRTAVREFFRWVRHGELHEIETVLHPGKLSYGRLISPEIEWADPQALARATEVGTLTFRMHSPLLYDRLPRIWLGAPNQRVMPELGNFSSTPEVWAYGASNPVVKLYRANGSLLKSVTFTKTLGSDDYMWIKSDDMLVQSVLNGVIADDPNSAPPGDPFFVLDPADGDPVNNLYPYFVSTNAYLQVLVRKVDTV